MMWWDRLAGTYKRPELVRTFTDPAMVPKVQGGSNFGATEAEREATPAETKKSE